MSGAQVGALVGAVFAALGAAIMLFGRSFIARDRAIGRWPKAPATVTSSRYEASDRTMRDAHGYDVSSTSYTPVVTYQYTVGEKTFRGDKVSRAVQPTSNAARVKECIDRYPPGARVEVFYDPTDPATAYLETSTSAGAVFLMVFGGVFALAGAGVLAMVLFTG